MSFNLTDLVKKAFRKNKKQTPINDSNSELELDPEDVFSKVKLEKSPAVVTIEMIHPRNFGLDLALTSQATGFVVDAEQGIILSNKHVVHEGPCRAKAKFKKNEEIDLLPIYRDPVHDFGFFKFNPEELTQTEKCEIELDAEGATVGRNALFIGNNGGERLSFVQTTIARIDRQAVELLDMNTFYITASDTGVGGSSGAPLLSSEGKAIALMAAGNDGSNISMYLPLFRVSRALKLLREKKRVPRGTLQVKFNYNTFEAFMIRNAISEETREMVLKTFPQAEGLLVVDKNLPKGPGRIAGIQNGDVLLKIKENMIVNYVQLEEELDSNIGNEISLTLIRELKEIQVKVTVQDHETIEVSKMVEVSNGIFHSLQYKLAAFVNLPIEGVFVAKEGYMFKSVPFASIIKRIAQVPINNLDDFISTIQKLTNGEIVSVAYQPFNDPNSIEMTTVTVDKRWYPFEVSQRNDEEGKWFYTKIEDLSEAKEKIQENMKFQSTSDENSSEISRYANAVVRLKCSTPFALDGNTMNVKATCGIIINKQEGLILANSESVTSTLMDVEITFQEARIIEGRVVFIHPRQPFAVIKFDVKKLTQDPIVKIEEVELSDEKPEIGEMLQFVGLNKSFEVFMTQAKVLSFRDTQLYGGEMRGFRMAAAPMEYVQMSSSGCIHGAYISKEHKIKALGIVPLGGMASITKDLKPMIAKISESNLRVLPITLGFLDLASTRIHGLNNQWADKLQKSMTLFQRKLLIVKKRMVNSEAYEKLQENDVLLSIDDEVVSCVAKFYQSINNKEKVDLTILRKAEELKVTVATKLFSTLGTTRILHFAGLILQDMHPALFYLSTPEILENGGVFVSHQEDGSPAQSAETQLLGEGPPILNRVIYRVNSTDVRDLQEFTQAIAKVKDGDFVRLKAKDISRGDESVHDIRLDLEYWRSRDMWLDEKGNWVSSNIQHS